MINKERLAQNLLQMAQFSATKGDEGITRLAFSDSDWLGRSFLIKLMEEAGLSIRIDTFGNVIGRREGTEPDLPAVMLGSHGDSVPNGGNYDGVVGVLAAIEVVRSLNEKQIQTEHPLEVVVFMCEESSRFGAATLGSRAMRGELSTQELLSLRDKTGISLFEVLQSRNLQPEAIAQARYTKPLKAFFEVHIEQGKVLEHEQIEIGIVTGIAAPTRMRVYLHGSADHSGATPMSMRTDGLCAAAEVVLAVEKIACKQLEPPVVGTVGVLQVHPGVMNVIPGEVELGIDIRSISAVAKARVVEAVKQELASICQQRKLAYDVQMISDEKPVAILPSVQNCLASICEEQKVSYLKMPSGAGHDAMHWVEYAPTGMLFIPCKQGISHNPAEEAQIDDIVRVTEILEAVVLLTTQANFSWE